MGCCVNKQGQKYAAQQKLDNQMKKALEQKNPQLTDRLQSQQINELSQSLKSVSIDQSHQHSAGEPSQHSENDEDQSPMQQDDQSIDDHIDGSHNHGDIDSHKNDSKPNQSQSVSEGKKSLIEKVPKHDESDEDEIDQQKLTNNDYEKKQKDGSKKKKAHEIGDSEGENKKKKKKKKKQKDDKDKKKKKQDGGEGEPKKKKKHKKKKKRKKRNGDDSDSDQDVHNQDPVFVERHDHLPEKTAQMFHSTDYHLEIKKFYFVKKEPSRVQITQKTFHDLPSYYELNFYVRYQHEDYKIVCKGVVRENFNDDFMLIEPRNIIEGTKHSVIETFFQRNRYFNVRLDEPDDTIISRYQHKIRRTSMFNYKMQDGRQVLDYSENREMIEYVQIYDMFNQQNLKNILFSHLIQDCFPQFKDDLIWMKELVFVFDYQPSFDLPELSTLCIFYDDVSYSLHDLYNLLLYEQMCLPTDFIEFIAKTLLNILIKFYKHNFYRLNFTIDTVFFNPGKQTFVLSCFNRLRLLGSLKQTFSANIDERAKHRYVRAFRKDQTSVANIIFAFSVRRIVSQPFEVLIKMPLIEKLDLISSLRLKQSIVNFLQQAFQYGSDLQSFDKVSGRLSVIKDSIQDLDIDMSNIDRVFTQNVEERQERFQNTVHRQNDISQDDGSISKPSISKASMPSFSQQSNESNEDENQEDLKPKKKKNPPKPVPNPTDDGILMSVLPGLNVQFGYVLNEDGVPYGIHPEKLDKFDIWFSEVQGMNILESFDNQKMLSFISKILPEFKMRAHQTKQELDQCRYSQILGLRESYDNSLEVEERSKLVNEMFTSIQKIVSTYQNPIYYVTLIKILDRTSQYDLLNLQDKVLEKLKDAHVVQKRLKTMLKKLKEKGSKIHSLRSYDKDNGLVQLRKMTLYQLLKAEVYINKSDYGKAQVIIQDCIKVLTNAKQQKSLLYAFIIYINGLISKVSLSFKIAMLNYEIAQNLYSRFFDYNHPFISEIDASLGELYQSQFDFDKAYQCYSHSYELKIQRNFPPDSDEVVQVLLKLLKVAIELDQTAIPLQIASQYIGFSGSSTKARNSNCMRSKSYGQLILVFGCILQMSCQYISAVLAFQKAQNIFFRALGSTNLLKFAKYRKDECLNIIRKKSKQVCGLLGRHRDDIYDQVGFKTLVDGAKLAYSVGPHTVIPPIQDKNQNLKCIMSLANFHVHKEEIDQAIKEYTDCLEMIKSQRKPGRSSGIVLMKLGVLMAQTKQYHKAQAYLIQSIQFFDRYLSFPFKYLNIIKALLLQSLVQLCRQKYEDFHAIFVQVKSYELEFRRVAKIRGGDFFIESRYSTLMIPHKYQLLIKLNGFKMVNGILETFNLLDMVQQFHHSYSDQKNVVEYAQRQLADLKTSLNFTSDSSRRQLLILQGKCRSKAHMVANYNQIMETQQSQPVEFDFEEIVSVKNKQRSTRIKTQESTSIVLKTNQSKPKTPLFINPEIEQPRQATLNSSRSGGVSGRALRSPQNLIPSNRSQYQLLLTNRSPPLTSNRSNRQVQFQSPPANLNSSQALSGSAQYLSTQQSDKIINPFEKMTRTQRRK